MFKNNKICVGGLTWTTIRGKAEDYSDKYPAGKLIDVYYNPDDPKDSCLERRADYSIFAMLSMGLVIMITGILFMSGMFP